jgi:hypothetical protein
MVSLYEFLNKVFPYYLKLGVVDEYFFTKYKISKNIFSRYNKNPAIYKDTPEKLPKFASCKLKTIVMTEIKEKPQRKDPLIKYLKSFLTKKEQKFFSEDTDLIVSIAISKFVKESDINYLYNIDDYKHKLIEHEKNNYAILITNFYSKACYSFSKRKFEIALMYSEKCINTLINLIEDFEQPNNKSLLSDYDFIPENILNSIKYLKEMFNSHNHDIELTELCIKNLKIVVKWFVHDYLNLNIKIDDTIKKITCPILNINIAQSSLVVIRAITETWDLDKLLNEFGIKTNYKNIPWSDNILKLIDNNTIQIGIYNKNRTLKYINNNKDNNLEIVSNMCYSMGGKNFYILSKENSIWHKMNFEEVKNNLDGQTVCLPIGSDMHQNFLEVFDLTEEDIKKRKINICDNPTKTGFEIFNLCPNALLVSGQNLRFQAIYRGGYIEVIEFLTIPKNKRKYLKESSENSLIINKSLYDYIEKEDFIELVNEAKENFNDQWIRSNSYPKNLDALKNICDQSNLSDEENYFMIRNILFETYRFGQLT